MNHINCNTNLEIRTKYIWQFDAFLLGNLAHYIYFLLYQHEKVDTEKIIQLNIFSKVDIGERFASSYFTKVDIYVNFSSFSFTKVDTFSERASEVSVLRFFCTNLGSVDRILSSKVFRCSSSPL